MSSDFSTRPADRYSPLYFLAALGAGGLAVTFFMIPMFWIPHPGQPVPIFEDLTRALATQGPAVQAAVVVAMLGIAALAALHLKLLFWNIASYRRFAASPAFEALVNSNADTQRLAMPLTFAMSINVGFILGLIFVPGLWSIVEYLFPLALIAFALVGLKAIQLAGQFLRRVLGGPDGFDLEANGSFAQLMPAFAFAMVAVGFAAPAAMSLTPATVAVGLVGSTFFAAAAVLWAAAFGLAALPVMLRKGVAPEAAPTLMVIIPILTVLGIMMVRQDHGLHVTFDAHGYSAGTLMLLSKLISVQVIFGLIGLTVLRAQGYWQRFVVEGASPGAYALVCPGVALSVITHFWVNKGLVGAGLIAKFGIAWWTVTGAALALQVAMIVLVAILHRRHFGRTAGVTVAAE